MLYNIFSLVVVLSYGNRVLPFSTSSSARKSYPLILKSNTYYYLVRVLHGYQPKNLIRPRPGTTNINLQGFVFVVPGFSGYGRYTASCQSPVNKQLVSSSASWKTSRSTIFQQMRMFCWNLSLLLSTSNIGLSTVPLT